MVSGGASNADERRLEALYAEMEAEARNGLPRSADPAQVWFERGADVRYLGQGYDVAVPVTAGEIRALQRELERRMADATRRPSSDSTAHAKRSARGAPARWNPDPEDVQKSVAQLVLTIVEFLRQLMERQAIRRMEANTLTEAEVEAVGVALMRLEETVREIGARFGLAPEELNLDLGPISLI